MRDIIKSVIADKVAINFYFRKKAPDSEGRERMKRGRFLSINT
jgi:hypothetical protein